MQFGAVLSKNKVSWDFWHPQVPSGRDSLAVKIVSHCNVMFLVDSNPDCLFGYIFSWSVSIRPSTTLVASAVSYLAMQTYEYVYYCNQLNVTLQDILKDVKAWLPQGGSHEHSAPMQVIAGAQNFIY